MCTSGFINMMFRKFHNPNTWYLEWLLLKYYLKQTYFVSYDYKCTSVAGKTACTAPEMWSTMHGTHFLARARLPFEFLLQIRSSWCMLSCRVRLKNSRCQTMWKKKSFTQKFSWKFTLLSPRHKFSSFWLWSYLNFGPETASKNALLYDPFFQSFTHWLPRLS